MLKSYDEVVLCSKSEKRINEYNKFRETIFDNWFNERITINGICDTQVPNDWYQFFDLLSKDLFELGWVLSMKIEKRPFGNCFLEVCKINIPYAN